MEALINKSRVRLLSGLLLATLLPIAGSVCAETSDKLREQVLAALSTKKQKQFHFVQEKKLAILEKTLVTEGELLIGKNEVVWSVNKPYTMRYEIYPDHIKEIDSAGERVMPVGNNPVANALTKTMSALFSGKLKDAAGNDETTIDTVVATGDLSAWQLKMAPHISDLKSMVTDVVIQGKQGSITTVLVEETNGDSTTIHLQ